MEYTRSDVLGIRDDLVVVHRAARHVGAHLLEARAPVGGAKEAARLVRGLDDGVHHVGVGRRDREADAPHVLLGQAVLDLLPRGPGVGRLVQRRFGTAVNQRPHVAPPLVGRGVEHVGVARVHRDVVDAGVLADGQHGLPRLPGVGRLVEAAVAARRPERAHRGHVDHLRVAGVHDDAADVHRVLEAEVLPRLAAVGGAVDAVPVGNAALAVVLPRADPDDVRVVGVERDAPDRERAFRVEDRRPRDPGVLGLPDAADRRDVPGRAIVRAHRDVDHPAGRHRGADVAPAEARKGRAGQEVLPGRRRPGLRLLCNGGGNGRLGGSGGFGLRVERQNACRRYGAEPNKQTHALHRTPPGKVWPNVPPI